MRNERGAIDWARTEEHATHLSADQLFGALDDIHKTLPKADALDRINGTDNGGYYRDVASVYHREIAKRREMRTFEYFDTNPRRSVV
jgi:hypothetical protein